MKTVLRITFLLSLTVLLASITQAQKKVQSFKVEKEINLPADKVWQIVGEDYGAIANSHPRIISSNYINGSLKAGEGAERVCNFNDKGTQYLKEKIVDFDPENRTFINQVYQAGKFPVDEELTRAVYKVEQITPTSSRLTFDMQFRTKPAFMGGMMKGSFKKLINDYFIAIEHHIKTGEKVTRDNFKDIRKMYASKS